MSTVGESKISSYQLGKNYAMSKESTGFWDWYEWSYANWGVKWNACDSEVFEYSVTFLSPWGYPDKVFERLGEMFPEETFRAEMIFEDESDVLYIREFQGDSVSEWSENIGEEDDF